MAERDDRGRWERHAGRLKQLGRPGGPLSRESPYVTMRNPRWFADVGGGPVPSPERDALHRRLLDEHGATGSIALDGKPKAIVLAGPPGAGKSTSQDDLIAASGLDREAWRVINNDDFKDHLLRAAIDDGTYETELLPPGLGEKVYPRELATLVHEEAGLLTEQATGRAIRERANLIVDGTLSNEADAHQLMEDLQEAGYSVQIAVVDAPRDVVEARVEHRWRSGYEAAENGTAETPLDAEFGGRSVPSGVVRHMYARDDSSSCLDVARAAAEQHDCVAELREYRVDRPDGKPGLLQHRGRLGKGPLLDGETYLAGKTAQASQAHPPRPHVSAPVDREAGRPRRPAPDPGRGAER